MGGLLARRDPWPVRPEYLQDPARTVREPHNGVSFSAAIDVIEWMGADLYAYFDLRVAREALQALPDDLRSEAGDANPLRVVARLDPASQVAEGKAFTLWLDTTNVQLFDARTGENLKQSFAVAVQKR